MIFLAFLYNAIGTLIFLKCLIEMGESIDEEVRVIEFVGKEVLDERGGVVQSLFVLSELICSIQHPSGSI
jgi:hypothetical protein